MPRRNASEYGELESISYNSLSGTRETVNIPVLWVDDEVYVLIDNIFKALKELLVKPRIIGNIDKIPFFIFNAWQFQNNYKISSTVDIFVTNDN